MVYAMKGDELRRRVHQTTGTLNNKKSLKPCGAAETAMRQQAVVPNIDAQRSVEIQAEDRHDHASPTEEPGNQRSQRENVNRNHNKGVRPISSLEIQLALVSW